jgi:hypothetical protein
MLHIDTEDVVEYEPGHVLALEMKAPQEVDGDGGNSKTQKDAEANGGWMRGPYTVSRSTDKSIDILVKVVGQKSKQFSIAKSGTLLVKAMNELLHVHCDMIVTIQHSHATSFIRYLEPFLNLFHSSLMSMAEKRKPQLLMVL